MADASEFARLLTQTRNGFSTENTSMWVVLGIAVVVIIVLIIVILATQYGWFGFQMPMSPQLLQALNLLYQRSDINFAQRQRILNPFMHFHRHYDFGRGNGGGGGREYRLPRATEHSSEYDHYQGEGGFDDHDDHDNGRHEHEDDDAHEGGGDSHSDVTVYEDEGESNINTDIETVRVHS